MFLILLDLICKAKKYESEIQKLCTKVLSFFAQPLASNFNNIAGSYKWVDGASASYTMWCGNEPNGGSTENCAVVSTCGWIDESCSKSMKYICQKSFH